jgi:hypothetical protein
MTCNLVVMRLVLRAMVISSLVALSAIVGACASESAGWAGDDVHSVDGYWLQREAACADLDCDGMVRAALIAVEDPAGSTVTKAATAQWPRAYRDGHGGTVLMGGSGGVQMSWSAVVLDLADGSRRVVPVRCDTGHAPTVCVQDLEIDAPRVGHEPWLAAT